ncbi:unnamed protein product [Prorocentrum cordatum]|uniref:Protein kinase domain-containing protein n=1 Tax=Prorocentrum cordatum TaxID=2364126 RepID=A0ABN9XNM4_9DINO|nr:unnamed protein product [Polarella glacialis]
MALVHDAATEHAQERCRLRAARGDRDQQELLRRHGEHTRPGLVRDGDQGPRRPRRGEGDHQADPGRTAAPAWRRPDAQGPTRGGLQVSRREPGGGGPTAVRAKLIDFDTVESWQPGAPRASEVLGTDGYIAPEAYLGEYSPAVDIYCAGVIMYKLLTRRWPSPSDFFDDEPGQNWVGSPAMLRIHERLKVAQVNFRRQPLNATPEAAALCSRLLAFDPAARPSAEEALRHPWFSLPEEALQQGRPAARR